MFNKNFKNVFFCNAMFLLCYNIFIIGTEIVKKELLKMSPTILCVDDDDFVRETISRSLKKELFEVIEADSKESLFHKLESNQIDIILLDIVLPDGNGIEIVQTIRKTSSIPIIIISSKEEEIDKVMGIEMGADDYITKPVSLRELKARINAVLRRVENKDDDILQDGVEKKYFGEWVIDPSRYQVFDKAGNSAKLTTAEFMILNYLSSCANRTLSRDKIFQVTREVNHNAYDRVVDVQITRIRKKLKDDAKDPQFIKTIRGIGYMFCNVKE